MLPLATKAEMINGVAYKKRVLAKGFIFSEVAHVVYRSFFPGLL